MKVVRKQTNSRMCFICGMDNPIGLKAQFYTMEDGSVATPFMFLTEHQSFPGRVHGGLITTMLDEMGLRAMWAKNTEDDFGVTLSLETKFRKPVPYSETIIGRAVVEKDTSKFVIIRSELIGGDGSVLSEASVRYLRLPPARIAADADPHKEMCYLIEDDVTELIY